MNLLHLNWDTFLYFYDTFLGETPLNTHQKTIAVPRYSHDSISLKLLIQMFFKTCLSNIFLFYCTLLSKSYTAVHYSLFPRLNKLNQNYLTETFGILNFS